MEKRYFVKMENSTPFASLTDKDKELIEYYIRHFAPSEYSRANPSNIQPLDVILHEWNNEKETLYKLLGNELIQTRFYSYKQNHDGIMHDMSMNANKDSAYRNFTNWWNRHIHFNADVKFRIESIPHNQYSYSNYYYIEKAYSFNCLAKNAYDEQEFKIFFEDDPKPFKVSIGMKPMKILHKFVERYGDEQAEEIFEKFRIWHSQFLNQSTIDGQLCISIHPLDYMTMSDNDNGWTSCMRWAGKNADNDPGDYRAGTVECMNSPYIVIAYLHNAKHPYVIDEYNDIDFKWNSKRWRELFIVNDACISEIKGYPYQDENLTNAVIAWIRELAEKNLGWTYNDEEYNMTKEIKDDEGNTIYLSFEKPDHMYKDMGVLNKHAGRINFKQLRENKIYKDNSMNYWMRNDETVPQPKWYTIQYGGVGTCMFCGGDLYDGDGDSLVLCDQCEDANRCPCCGNIINDDDAYYIDELDAYICYDCYSYDAGIDNFTEESHMMDNMDRIAVLLGYDFENKPVFYDRIAYCYDPTNNLDFQNIFNKPAIRYYDRDFNVDYYSRHYDWYVTLDMVKEDYIPEFCNAFEVYPRKLSEFYSNCIDDNELLYDADHNKLFDDEEEY